MSGKLVFNLQSASLGSQIAAARARNVQKSRCSYAMSELDHLPDGRMTADDCKVNQEVVQVAAAGPDVIIFARLD